MYSIVSEKKGKSYAHLKRTCSSSLRNAILEFYPGLGCNEGFWRLFTKLAFSVNQTAIISQEVLAYYFNEVKQLDNKNFVGLNHLREFQQKVAPLEIQEYNYKENLARIATLSLPVELMNLIELELKNSFKDGKRVFLTTGNLVTKNNEFKLEREDLGLVKPAFYEQAAFIQNYLNNLPRLSFNSVVSNITEARKHLYDLDASRSRIINDVKTQERILATIREQPKPIYSVSSGGNTARLFAVNASLQGIHSHLRQYLTKDWIELDLAQAHLAIVATLWKIPVVYEFLKSEESIWETLLPAMGFFEKDKEVKSLVKEFLYSLVYGMSQDHLQENIEKTLGTAAYEAFINHYLIKNVIEARKIKVKELTKAGTYTTVLGKQYTIYNKRNFKTKKFETNVNSVLATEASEVELLLMYPIFKLASTSKSFKVLLYQFDGVSINVKDKSRIESVIRAIQKEVDKTATSLNIPTRLEVKITKPQITVGTLISNSIKKHFKF